MYNIRFMHRASIYNTHIKHRRCNDAIKDEKERYVIIKRRHIENVFVSVLCCIERIPWHSEIFSVG